MIHNVQANNSIIYYKFDANKPSLISRNNSSKNYSQPVTIYFSNNLINEVVEANKMKIKRRNKTFNLRDQNQVSGIDPTPRGLTWEELAYKKDDINRDKVLVIFVEASMEVIWTSGLPSTKLLYHLIDFHITMSSYMSNWWWKVKGYMYILENREVDVLCSEERLKVVKENTTHLVISGGNRCRSLQIFDQVQSLSTGGFMIKVRSITVFCLKPINQGLLPPVLFFSMKKGL